MTRDARLDALRGLFLLLMASNHLPSPLTRWTSEPLGFVTSAEGFILLGAYFSGRLYLRQRAERGAAAVRRRFLRRSVQIYSWHLTAVFLGFGLALLCGPHFAPTANLFSKFLADPGWVAALAVPLLHMPPLFDVLPMYVFFLALTPLVLESALRWGWKPVVWCSGLCWIVGQGMPELWLQNHLLKPGLLDFGAFQLLAWQFLWVIGLAWGATLVEGPYWRRIPKRLWILCAGLALACFVFRHGLGPFTTVYQDYYPWLDKWRLGFVRLVNLAALGVLLVRWNPPVPSCWVQPLAAMGRNSLLVFNVHIFLMLAGMSLQELWPLPPWMLSVQFLVVAVLMFGVAWLGDRWGLGKRRPRRPDAPPPGEISSAPARQTPAE